MLLSALLLLLLVAGRCSRLELVGRSPRTRTGTRTGTETRTETRAGTETRTGLSRDGVKVLEAHPRDPRHKEKFLKHLTGPLNFNTKCRKHFYRLYHNTRDCSIPDYYKRCARLLTRLANSPRCAER